jgi:hypothetical protein
MQLTDAQLLTACLAIIIPISSLIYSNSRINEAKETLRAEMKTLEATLSKRIELLEINVSAKIDALDKKIDILGERFENALKLHVAEHHR